MRTAAVVPDVRAVGRHGHLCWVFDHPDEYAVRAGEFLAAGLAAGERVWFVAADPAALDAARRRGGDRLDEAVHRGAARPERGGDWASLSGELDMASHELFPSALERADPAPVDGRLVLDARGLTFIDHHAVAALGEHARRRGATATIRTSLGVAGRIVEVLGLADVRVDLIGPDPGERAA